MSSLLVLTATSYFLFSLIQIYEHHYVCAEAAYSRECFDVLLSLVGLVILIHEKSPCYHLPINAASE